MQRILIAHAPNRRAYEIAGELCACLRNRGYEVELADASSTLPPPQDYDAIILGSAVHHGRHAQRIVDYVREHHDVLDQMPTGFFSVSLGASLPFAPRDPGGHLARMFRDLHWLPDHVEAFGRLGVNQPRKLADLVAVSLSEARLDELSPTYGPI
jgi:menaquinone-dependent protoporphyrinogen oxidase